MFPLKTIVVGHSTGVMESIRHELRAVRASIHREYPTIAMAEVDLSANGDELPLVILHLDDDDAIGQLAGLSMRFPGMPILAVVEPARDHLTEPSDGIPPRVLRTMRAGAMQVVLAPIDADDFRSAVERLGMQFGRAREQVVVAVSGVTGGAGSTSLAMNLAYELHRQTGKPTVLAEPTARVGHLASYLDLQPNHTFADLLAFEQLDVSLVRNCLVPVKDNISALCGPQTHMAMHDERACDKATQLERMHAIVSLLKRTAPIVVLDVRSTFDAAYFETLALADRVVLIAEQTFPSLRMLQVIRDALTERDIPPTEVLVNKYDASVRGLSLDALRATLNIPALRGVPFDPSMRDAIHRGKFLREYSPRAMSLAELKRLACRLANTQPSVEQSSGHLRKLLDYFLGNGRSQLAAHA
jgi:pilus assembly protein CpaE